MKKCKRLLLIILCLFSGYATYGQDLIVTVPGDSLNCKITEVKNEAIYFRYDVSGSVVSLPMNQVATYKFDFYRSRKKTPAVAVSMRGRSELSVYFGGGLSNADAASDPSGGRKSSGTGGMFGIGYTWFLSGRWGVVTGIEASLYRFGYQLDDHFIDTSRGELYELTYEFQNQTEKLSAFFLQIPAMAQFQTGRFFASGGLKIGIPIKAKNNLTADNLTTSGYYGGVTDNNDPEYGLGEIGAISHSGNVDVTVLLSAAIEAGGQWMLGKRTNLYAGVWFDRSVNNIRRSEYNETNNQRQKDEKKTVVYDPDVPGCLKYNSNFERNDHLGVWSMGVKLKLSYSL